MKKHWLLVLLFAISAAMVGCTTPPAKQLQAESGLDSAPDMNHWEGNFSLVVDGSGAKVTQANFELDGNAMAGELRLFGPFGSQLAAMQWRPGEAIYTDGQQRRSFVNMEELTAQTIGAPLPFSQLFAWFRGENVSIAGWKLSPIDDTSSGKRITLNAIRLQPLPQIQLSLSINKY
jgi:outer membrane biogenesis lipoprotein LolB